MEQDVAVPQQHAVQDAEQAQPQQASPQQHATALIRFFAPNQEDRHAEQQGEEGAELVLEEDVRDPQPHQIRVAGRARRRCLGHHDLEGPGKGHGVDGEDAQNGPAAQHVELEDAVAGPGGRQVAASGRGRCLCCSHGHDALPRQSEATLTQRCEA